MRKRTVGQTARNISLRHGSIAAWAEANGEKYRTVAAVTSGARGRLRVGVSGRIIEKLKKQGLWDE